MKQYNFTPGPIPMDENIKNLLTEDLPYFRTDTFSRTLLTCESGLLEEFNAPVGSRVIFLTASGTAAMDATIQNLIPPHETSLVINGGGFGARFVEILNRQNKDYIEFFPDDGQDIDFDRFSTKDTNNVIVNGHETTTGVLYDVNALGKITHSEGKNLIVDAISMSLTENIDMTKDFIDCLILSSHKALGLHPGMSFIILNKKLVKKVLDNKFAHSSLYFDFSSYLVDGERGQTPFTPAVGIILQLEKLLQNIKLNEVGHYYNRAKYIATYFREKIRQLPVTIFSNALPNAMTPILLDEGYNAHAIAQELNKKKIFVTPSGGHLKARLLRISHMGNQTIEDVDVLVYELKQLLSPK
jgi:aspartate aminotransferase-like enzyme